MLKLCSVCKLEKPLSGFRKDKTQKDGYHCRCKVCVRAAIKSDYITKYGDKARARNATRTKAQREFVNNYKATHPCECCGESTIVCLDFHHRDPSQKDFQLSSVATRSIETILAEIEKCVVLCKNCHAKVHAGVITINGPLV